jgi:hypothetical protein
MSCLKSAIMAAQFDVARKTISYMTEHWKENEQVQEDVSFFQDLFSVNVCFTAISS